MSATSCVTPLVGVWIEITNNRHDHRNPLSLPLWECGLKSFSYSPGYWFRSVTPLVGVWIEIYKQPFCSFSRIVTPLVGVWIEITNGL